MRVMVLVKATNSSEAGMLPTDQLLNEMGKYNEELVRAGIMLAGDGLKPSSHGARVRFSGADRTVLDGPFAETKELVAGYWLWQVKSMDEAIAWVKRCPNPMPEESEIEIRPVYELADFSEVMAPETKELHEQIAADVQSNHLEPPNIVNGPERIIAGENASYTFESRVNIPLQWQRFAGSRAQLPASADNVSYGVCWNFQPGRGFDYLTGVEIVNGAQLPAGMSQVRVPAGRYAVFTHRDHASSIAATLDAIWTQWLPNSGEQAAESPAFERYTESFDPQTGHGGFEIWVPLK